MSCIKMAHLKRWQAKPDLASGADTLQTPIIAQTFARYLSEQLPCAAGAQGVQLGR